MSLSQHPSACPPGLAWPQVLILILPSPAETTVELSRTLPRPCQMPSPEPEEELNGTQQALIGLNCPKLPQWGPHPVDLLPLGQEHYLSSALGLQPLFEL